MSQLHCRQILLSRQAELEVQINRRRDILTTPLSEATDELSAYDQHPGDAASDTFEREKELGLLQMLQAELDQVHRALDDIQNGGYGICNRCGREIEPARLERLVHTNLCAACARIHIDDFHRPAEEKVIHYDIAFMPDWDIAGYSYDEYK
ncbi:MAG: TraR/DksA C4-type zinc finger protein [Syntrophomonadaceae bacterium]